MLCTKKLLTEQCSHEGLIHAGEQRGMATLKVRVCVVDRHMTACRDSRMDLQPLLCDVFHTVPGHQRVSTLEGERERHFCFWFTAKAH